MRIDSLEVEREVVQRVMKGRHIPDVFLETKFPERSEGESSKTFVKRTISAVRRLIRKHLPIEESERIIYIGELLGLEPDSILVEDHDESNEAHRLISVTTERKAESPHKVIRVPYPVPHKKYEYVYLHLYRKMKPSYHRTARKFSYSKGEYIPIADLESYLAEVSLLKALDRYINEDRGRLITSLFDYMYRDGVLYLNFISDEVADALRKQAEVYGVDQIDDRRLGRGSNTTYDSYVDGTLDVMTDGSFSSPFTRMVPIILSFVGEIVDIRNLVKDAAIEKADYAKAFQTKKHIPKTHREKMENNRFLDVYGYVELDEDVDLKKFEVIEEHLATFIEKTGMPKAADHSFRIKRLGNYRAAGIYFSGFQTTIFDLRHPEAFGHEWMHQIDFTWGKDGRNVHEESTFHPLVLRYQRMVKEAVADLATDDPFYSTWRGNTKYNRSYYMKKTEIFARLGEVYLSTLINDDNSLIKTASALEESPVHPTDETTVRMVVAFYENLFARMLQPQKV